MPSNKAASPSRARSRGDTGCAIDTCATSPLPKNELAPLYGRSTNWSPKTNVPGGSSSLNEPQADSDTRSVTPARLSTSILAVVDVGRRQPVALVVARQEHD